ncbi:MAG: hypothetical protein ACI4S2_02165 [Lachnospiraceae bacterium]
MPFLLFAFVNTTKSREEERIRFTKYEQATVINFNAGEKNATVYTIDKAVLSQLDVLVNEFLEVYHLDRETEYDQWCSVDKNCITYRKPRRLTEV